MKLTNIFQLSLLMLGTFFGQAAHAQTFSVIHNFGDAAGSNPHAGVTLRAGVLYGTTYNGGYGQGSIYRMTGQGSTWTATIIYPFSSDVGVHPAARVVFGPDGRLYGTALIGGAFNGGTVFDLLPPLSACKTANCFWKPTVIHEFSGADGLEPGFGDSVWDQQGNLYGVTTEGGNSVNGNVFQLTPSGNTWTETTVHNFTGSDDGRRPIGGLVVDGNGNVFGTTSAGGPMANGIVFELSYVAGVGWNKTLIYAFSNASEGGLPIGGLLLDKAGNLYGTTAFGGTGGGGTVFELSPSGSSWTFHLLYSFVGRGVCGPQASLTMDATGNLYGTTLCGGDHMQGNVFKLTNTGSGWTYTSLHDFTGGDDGGSPYSNVTIDTDGVTLYGTAEFGGSNGAGVVWMIKP